MTDFLSRLQTKPIELRPLMVVYGPEGAGKSSVAATFHPKTEEIVAGLGGADPGLIDLMSRGALENFAYQQFQTWTEVREFTRGLIEQDHKFKCVIYDQLTDMLRLLFEFVAKEKFNGDLKEFLKFNAGSELAMSEWDAWWADLAKLRAKVTVICLAHATTEKWRNPEGQDWDRYVIDLFKVKQANKSVDFTSAPKKCCSELGFLRPVAEGDKGKGIGGKTRDISFVHDAAYDAKNRYGITETINLGADAKASGTILRNALIAALKAQKGTK